MSNTNRELLYLDGLSPANSQQQAIRETGNNTTSSGISGNSYRNNEVRSVMLYGIPIIALVMDSQERLCLAQISNTLLKSFSYNEIHNRRVALGITCVQCTPVQLELLRRAGAMPVSSRRCGMITKREAERLCKSFLAETAPPKLPDTFSFEVYHQCAWEAERLCKSFLAETAPPKLPDTFSFEVYHQCAWGCRGEFTPSRYNSSRWRRHIKLIGNPEPPDEVSFAWEDVKAMFNGGSRKRAMAA
ncbi:unnamed protein product, partial [Medioppia subpectinata]